MKDVSHGPCLVGFLRVGVGLLGALLGPRGPKPQSSLSGDELHTRSLTTPGPCQPGDASGTHPVTRPCGCHCPQDRADSLLPWSCSIAWKNQTSFPPRTSHHRAPLWPRCCACGRPGAAPPALGAPTQAPRVSRGQQPPAPGDPPPSAEVLWREVSRQPFPDSFLGPRRSCPSSQGPGQSESTLLLLSDAFKSCCLIKPPPCRKRKSDAVHSRFQGAQLADEVGFVFTSSLGS